MTTENQNTNPLYQNIPSSLLPLTPQEEDLLQLYATVKSYEREAALQMSIATKAKLVAADEKYKQQQQQQSKGDWKDENVDSNSIMVGNDEESETVENSTTNTTTTTTTKISIKKTKTNSTKNKNTTKISNYPNNHDEKNNNQDDVDDYYDEHEAESRELDRKRQAKLDKLRMERDLALARQEQQNEANSAQEKYRLELLSEHGTSTNANNSSSIINEPSLKKKQRLTMENGLDDVTNTKSLIANMDVTSTPIHDFSKKLEMSRISGKVLFPKLLEASDQQQQLLKWSPPLNADSPQDRCLEMQLEEFNAHKINASTVVGANNTIAIKFTAPEDSNRFSLNIATPTNHNNYNSVLFHFNPRQFQRGGNVVINDKTDGVWNQALNIPLSTIPLVFGKPSCTLIIQINGDGFDTFVDGVHCARWEHKRDLPLDESLILQFPSTDDYGNRENVIVYKVWWGYKAPMAKTDVSDVAGINAYDALHKKKLFIRGLPKITTEQELDLRRAELERAFSKYGGALGVMVTVHPNSTIAFVEVDSERQADLALVEMAGRYIIHRARQTRQEARVNVVSDQGIMKETSDWDESI